MNPADLDAHNAEAAATRGEPWGLSSRISKCAAFVSALIAFCPDLLEDPQKFLGIFAAAFGVFELDTETAQGVAFQTAVDLIATARAGSNGERAN